MREVNPFVLVRPAAQRPRYGIIVACAVVFAIQLAAIALAGILA